MVFGDYGDQIAVVFALQFCFALLFLLHCVFFGISDPSRNSLGRARGGDGSVPSPGNSEFLVSWNSGQVLWPVSGGCLAHSLLQLVAAENAFLEPRCYVKHTISLPRQAEDKH